MHLEITYKYIHAQIGSSNQIQTHKHEDDGGEEKIKLQWWAQVEVRQEEAEGFKFLRHSSYSSRKRN
jgi:hypothetical protein